MPSEEPSFVTASDLEDFAYCPRSYWYRTHPPPEGPAPGSARLAAAGARSHVRRLGGERRRAEHGVAYWALVVLGVALVIGGVAWWF
jgi:CRISPR/Cas system-associated exonuclease Cas4 (RecB family)